MTTGYFRTICSVLIAIGASILLQPTLGLVSILIITTGQLALAMSPLPLMFYIENASAQPEGIIIILAPAAVLYYYHRRFSWLKIIGVGFCLHAAASLLSILLLIGGWYVDVDAINEFLLAHKAIEDRPLVAPLQGSFYLLFSALIFGIVGIVLLKKWRVLLVAFGVAVSAVFSTVAWASMNNITSYCFVNGYWEDSPVHGRIIEYLEDSDDSGKVYPSIIYVAHFYLDGSLMRGKGCYTSDDKARYALLKKSIFYYPEFPEIAPVSLQDMIANKAEQNDVPAMLLLAHMYATGKGVEKNEAQGKFWWDKATSSSDDWLAGEEAFVFGTRGR